MVYLGEGEAMTEKTNFVQGFEVKDKAEVEGIARGLRYAIGFCNDESTDKESLDELATVLERETEWLF